MSHVYVSRVLDASVDAVWALLGRFEGLPDVLENVESELEHGSAPVVGAVRRLVMPGAPEMRERLVGMDAADRSYRYEMPSESIPFPIRSYLSTVRVRPVTASGSTFAEWFCDFDCDADVEAKMQRAFERSYTSFFDQLEKRLGSGSSSPAAAATPSPR